MDARLVDTLFLTTTAISGFFPQKSETDLPDVPIRRAVVPLDRFNAQFTPDRGFEARQFSDLSERQVESDAAFAQPVCSRWRFGPNASRALKRREGRIDGLHHRAG